MTTNGPRAIRRWLPGMLLALTLAVSTARAVDLPTEIVVPLDERLLLHLETTATALAAKEQSDPALKKDFETCIKDKKITGDTFGAVAASMAARHPRVAAALAAEGWKPGDFYLAYLTVITMPYLSELSHGGVPDENRGVRRNVAFYDKHSARILALIGRMNPLTGLEARKN